MHASDMPPAKVGHIQVVHCRPAECGISRPGNPCPLRIKSQQLDTAVGIHAIDTVAGIAGDIEIAWVSEIKPVGNARKTTRIDLRFSFDLSGRYWNAQHLITLTNHDKQGAVV